MFHRPVINITTTPWEWPARTEARHYSNIYSACPAFSSKAPLGFFVDLDPPLESIKGRVKNSPRGDDFKINTSSNSSFSFSETWDQLPLLQLVTPTQAPQYKEIQYSPSPLDVGPSLSEPG
jgi:hypothetical protein